MLHTKKIILCLLYISLFQVYAIDMNANIVKSFQLGSNPGQLGFNKDYVGTELHYSPRVLSIYNDEIYIIDSLNNRISVFSLEGEYLRKHDVSKDIVLMGTVNLKINEKYIAFVDISFKNLYVLNKETNTHYIINSDVLSKEVYSDNNYFLINEYVIVYNADRQYECYDSEGNIIPISSIDYLFTYSNPELAKLGLDDMYLNFLQMNNLLVYHDMFLDVNYDIFKNFLDTFKNELDLSSGAILSEQKIKINRYCCIDSSDNLYWTAYNRSGRRKMYIVVTTKWGQVLSAFENPLGSSYFATSQSGDIYYLKYSPDGVELWRTDRSW